MVDFIRMTKNFVNLGKLYSIPQRGRPRNSVNLGDLYSTPRHKRPTGFAYFEDGSVFINAKTYAEHDAFEAEMKLLQPFVRGPSPKLDQIRRTNADRQRLIVIAKSRTFGSSHTILARNAREGERIAVERWPFEQIEFEPDPSHSYLISAKFDRDPKILGHEHRKTLVNALATFRGTLIDGILQPNVRLGNGLTLSTSVKLNVNADVSSLYSFGLRRPPEKGKEVGGRRGARVSQQNKQLSARKGGLGEREAELERREQQLLLLQQQLLMQSMAPMRNRFDPPGSYNLRQESHPFDHYDGHARYAQPAETNPKISDFELRERELHHREELLRWKHKNFILQQKLAMARGTVPAEPLESEDSVTSSSPLPEYDSVTVAPEEPPGDTTSENGWNDPFADFSIDVPTSPQRAEPRRTRIKLPRRR